ncbi:MAG: hypothetical protein HN348_35940, partial [Proteobacteria bacterium]|nr:hypothetical protein [Pseudomonadota bacterium]
EADSKHRFPVLESRPTERAGPGVNREIGPKLPPWLLDLERTSWGLTPEVEAITQLVSRAQENSLKLSVSHHYDRLVLLGFDIPPLGITPWVSALAEALAKRPLRPIGEVPAEPLQAIDVPDVMSEARMAARYLSGDPSGSLALVTDTTTGDRLKAVLHANGLPCAWQESIPWQSHPLAVILRRIVSWFGPGTPHLRGTDIDCVWQSNLLGHRLPPVAREWLAPHLAGKEPSRRAFASTVAETRLIDAPLTRWINSLSSLGSRAGWVLVAHLRVLKAVASNNTLEEEFGVHTKELADFDALIAELLGDEGETPHDKGTLGALRRYLLSLGVHTMGDPLSMAVLAALREHAHWPATTAHLNL